MNMWKHFVTASPLVLVLALPAPASASEDNQCDWNGTNYRHGHIMGNLLCLHGEWVEKGEAGESTKGLTGIPAGATGGPGDWLYNACQKAPCRVQ